MTTISILRLSLEAALVAAPAIRAQEASPAPVDSTAVTAFSMKSGRIALSSLANPGMTYLPDGTYTSDAGTVIVILDGKISRLQRNNEVTEIASVRVHRLHGIMLTPNTNALNAVSEITMPTGMFVSADGSSSITVISGRPTRFIIPAPTASH